MSSREHRGRSAVRVRKLYSFITSGSVTKNWKSHAGLVVLSATSSCRAARGGSVPPTRATDASDFNACRRVGEEMLLVMLGHTAFGGIETAFRGDDNRLVYSSIGRMKLNPLSPSWSLSRFTIAIDFSWLSRGPAM
jgi:hypothetical protein